MPTSIFDLIDSQHRRKPTLVQYECAICSSPDRVEMAFAFGLGGFWWDVRLCAKHRAEAEAKRPKK